MIESGAPNRRPRLSDWPNLYSFRSKHPGGIASFALADASVRGISDGISLTVNEVEGNRFGVNIIPHTQAVTTLGQARPGQRVNLEVDMLARYVQRLLEHGRS